MALSAVLLSYHALTSLGIILGLTGGGPGTATQTFSLMLYDIAFRQLDYGTSLALMVIVLLFNGLLTVGYVGLSRRFGARSNDSTARVRLLLHVFGPRHRVVGCHSGRGRSAKVDLDSTSRLVIWTVAPLLIAVSVSLKGRAEVFASPQLIPQNPTLEAYLTTLSRPASGWRSSTASSWASVPRH